MEITKVLFATFINSSKTIGKCKIDERAAENAANHYFTKSRTELSITIISGEGI